jgi:hypothetical protein
VNNEIFERAVIEAIFVINFVNAIQTEQFGKFAGINGIIFLGIFGNPSQ